MECKFVCFFLLVLAGENIVCSFTPQIFFDDFIIRLRSWNIWNALKYYIKFQFSHHDREEGLCAPHDVYGEWKYWHEKFAHTFNSFEECRKAHLNSCDGNCVCFADEYEHTLKKKGFFVQTLREELAAEWEMENAIQLSFFQWFSVFLLVFISYKHVSFFFIINSTLRNKKNFFVIPPYHRIHSSVTILHSVFFILNYLILLMELKSFTYYFTC